MAVFNTGAVGLRGQDNDPVNPKNGDIFYASAAHPGRYEGYIAYEDTTSVAVHVQNSASTYGSKSAKVSSTTPTTFGNTDTITVRFSVPIVGWSATKVAVNEKNFAQTKVLSANATSTGVMSDLSFNNLTIGKYYTLEGIISILVLSTGGGVQGLIKNGTTQVGGFQYDQSASSTSSVDSGISTGFTADATTVTVELTSASASEYVEGSNAQGTNGTFLTLKEHNNTEETTKFN